MKVTVRSVLTVFLLLLVACRSSLTEIDGDRNWRHCYAIADEFRQRAAREKAQNGGFPAYAPAPFLHGTRFFDALAQEVRNDQEARELLTAMVSFSDGIRRTENAVLTDPASEARLNAISQCSHALSKHPDQAASRRLLIKWLSESPAIEDHYQAWKQWLGLLPLLRPFLKWRIGELHADERQWFEAREHFSSSETWAPQTGSAVPVDAEALPAAYAGSTLGVPMLEEKDLLALFYQYAPQLTMETTGPQDRPGSVRIESGRARIGSSETIAYLLPSWTRFDNRNLLQLNYVFWFPSRQPRRWIDLYSGELDSLIWRVTLNEQGGVLLYDSIHSCGCYHKYFIASDTVRVLAVPGSAEPANIFDLTGLDHRAGLRLLVTANEHYIVGVDNQSALAGSNYSMRPYDVLYALPDGSGTSNLFASDGTVKGSERLERFTLWPTGINNVGAMRQWGTHATGFVARQHFDDARLFDNYFTTRE